MDDERKTKIEFENARILRTAREAITDSVELLRNTAHLVSPPYARPRKKPNKRATRATEK